MEPVAQMMGLTPAQGAGTVGEHTAPVADGQGDGLGGLDDPAGPPDLQRLGPSTPRTGGNRAIAFRSRPASPTGLLWWWAVGCCSAVRP